MDARPIPSGVRVEGRVRVPPSKSVTQRLFNLALLARRPVTIERALDAEDTRAWLRAFRSLGWAVDRNKDVVRLEPGSAPESARIDCGDGGTMLRFLLAALATQSGEWILDGSARLRERPVGPLVDSLRRLGGHLVYLGEEGRAPVRVRGGRLRPGEVTLDAGLSSQYLSALMMACARADGEVTIVVTALTSAPYLDLTVDAVERFGGSVSRVADDSWRVSPATLGGGCHRVEGDWSAAAYPAAAAALTGGRVELLEVDPASRQGDRRFLDLLASMGAEIEWGEAGAVVTGRDLRSLDVDMSDMPDQVPTLAALAPFAAGRTRIRGVRHLRLKESDRLAAMSRELRRLGAAAMEMEDGLSLEGVWVDRRPPETPVEVDSHGDHRIAMSLALVGLRRPGVAVERPEVVAKSYPDFWEDLRSLLP